MHGFYIVYTHTPSLINVIIVILTSFVNLQILQNWTVRFVLTVLPRKQLVRELELVAVRDRRPGKQDSHVDASGRENLTQRHSGSPL